MWPLPNICFWNFIYLLERQDGISFSDGCPLPREDWGEALSAKCTLTPFYPKGVPEQPAWELLVPWTKEQNGKRDLLSTLGTQDNAARLPPLIGSPEGHGLLFSKHFKRQ